MGRLFTLATSHDLAGGYKRAGDVPAASSLFARFVPEWGLQPDGTSYEYMCALLAQGSTRNAHT
eukprot:3977582-Amphidinium_carterae.1